MSSNITDIQSIKTLLANGDATTVHETFRLVIELGGIEKTFAAYNGFKENLKQSLFSDKEWIKKAGIEAEESFSNCMVITFFRFPP